MKPRKTRKRVKGGNITSSMVCSPIVRNKTISKKSCLTPKILLKIQKEYNEKKPESQQIKDTDYKTIWTKLNNTFRCKKEKCWLNQIKNKELRKKIEKYIFAPEQPAEWKKNPNEWLSNIDILEVLSQYEKANPTFHFIGPTPIDFDSPIRGSENTCVTKEMCQFSLKNEIEKGKKQIGIIFNLSKHTESGSHWVSLFIDLDSRLIYYFDSNGITSPSEIKTFIRRIDKEGKEIFHSSFQKKENTISHQKGNTECGMYSLFFIITMLTGEIEGRSVSQKEAIDFFSHTKIPDKYVESFRYKYFNV
jgi:hypothetical protein